MLTASMLTFQISGRRGVCGARKLIPMPLRILRAPGRPALICIRQSRIGRTVVFISGGAADQASALARSMAFRAAMTSEQMGNTRSRRVMRNRYATL